MPRVRRVCVLAACIAVVAACESSTDTQSQITYTAQLKPANEVPPVTNAPNASGFFVATLHPTNHTLSYSLTWTGLTARATAAHIHGPAAAGEIASPIVDFAV